MNHSDLNLLARELESSDPYDRDAHRIHLDRLGELRNSFRREGATELATCLGAMASLLEELTGPRESVSRDQLRGVICRVLYALGNDVAKPLAEAGTTAPAAESAPPPKPAAKPTPPATRTGSISLDDGDDPEAPAPEPAPKPAEQPAPPPTAAPSASPEKADMFFGRMLIELGHVTEEQVETALDFHRAKGPRIGECLLLQGAISPERLLNALKIQELLRNSPEGITPESLARFKDGADSEPPDPTPAAPPAPPEAPERVVQTVTEDIFLGEVLLGAEIITKEELEKAMHRHHKTGFPIGEVLIQMGALTEDELEAGVELQQRLRRIAKMNAA
jgi:hypothetical protein